MQVGAAPERPYTSPMLWIALLVSCVNPPAVIGKDDTSSGTGDTAPPLEALLEVAPAFDPILGGPLAIRAVALDADSTTVTVLDPDGALVATVTDSWDGRDDSGAWAQAGAYTVHLQATLGSALVEQQAPVQVVRCGVVGAWAEGDDGVSATHVPLYWHMSRELQGPDLPIAQADSLEDAHEQPVQLAAPAQDLDFLPTDGSLPTAFTWDSRPILTLELGDSTVLGSSGLTGVGVRLELEGWTVISGGDSLDPSVPVVLQADEALGTGPGVLDQDLTLSFLVDDDQGSSWTIGQQALPVRWYLLLDAPAFQRPEITYNAWVAAIDPALRAIQGVAPTDEAVIDALVRWIYEDLGLSYDTRYGASYYTSYQSGWTPAVFQLSSFLRQGAGQTVNCSDCASILAAWATMLGAPMAYNIVLQNFDLNYIQAIGGDEFTHCPFGSWGCSFSYHAVASNDGGETIWDATLALDGDADPSNPPSDLLMVEHIDAQEYLDRLVMRGRATINYEGETLLQ